MFIYLNHWGKILESDLMELALAKSYLSRISTKDDKHTDTKVADSYFTSQATDKTEKNLQILVISTTIYMYTYQSLLFVIFAPSYA